MHGVLGEQGLRLLGGHGRVNNHILAFPPVDRGRDAVLITNLERFEPDVNWSQDTAFREYSQSITLKRDVSFMRIRP